MIYFWRTYHIKKFSTYEYKERKYTDVILSFDTETTTFFHVKDKWIVQNLNDDPDIYSQAAKRCLVYIWQIGINDDVVYGREIKDFFEFWERFILINPNINIMYVHNLGFDFTFICEYFPDDVKVFSKAAFKPMYVKSKSLCLEMRCSYMLTNMSLEKVGAQYSLDVVKQVGTMAYNIARLPITKLTDEEMNYIACDVLTINALIKQVFLKRYSCIADIPLTQTGEVRREIKQQLSNKWYLEKIKRINFQTVREYKIATRVLQGGYTHLNFFYNGDIVENVKSFDKSSSYPDVMCTRKYPMSRFCKWENTYTHEDNYAYIMYISIDNIAACSAWSYIARHKVDICVNGVVDNGKLNSADHCELWVTDVDYEVILNNYNYSNVTILECYRAFKDYLPKRFINIILKMYSDKTTLKHNPQFKDLYMQQKQKLNSLFGMCCTNDIRTEYNFNPFRKDWDLPIKLSDTDIAQKLEISKPFLSYYWAIYILAYARSDLWEMISQIGIDCVYCDTDSVKIVNSEKHLYLISEYNKRCDDRINTVCNSLKLDKKLFYPRDKKTNEICALGHFELDGEYTQFKSLGAKKYCYIENGDFHYVVAGLRKSYIDENGIHSTLKSMDDFQVHEKDDKSNKGVIPNARTVHWYLNDQQPTELVDRDGNTYLATNTHGIAMINTNYTFTISKDYGDFLKDMENIILDGRNQYTDYFRVMT